MIPRISTIKVTSATTPHPPGPVGGPMAMLAALEGLFISRFDVELEWLVVAGVTAFGGLAALAAEVDQRRSIARGEYVAGIAPHYLYIYLQQVVALVALFAVALVQTYAPGEHFVTGARDVMRIVVIVIFAPFVLILPWLFALAPPLGAAARAGQVAPDDAARASVDRAPYRSAATVTALGSLVALPRAKTGFPDSLLHPAQLLVMLALVSTTLVLVVDAVALREARRRTPAIAPASLATLVGETKAAALSFVVALLVAFAHAWFAAG